jgi:long-chain-fatty-acid--CoA ligase ACSBG
MSHDNLTFTAGAAAEVVKLDYNCEQLVSYLPLSHIAAQLVDLHIPTFIAATVTFAKPDALKGSLPKTLQAVRPTLFLGVPRVYEKIQEKMLEVGRQNTGLKKAIAQWAKASGLHYHNSRIKHG